jgi:hypothetical protein
MKSGEFRVRRVKAKDHGLNTRLSKLLVQRIRKKFKRREEADGEKNRLEVEAANADSGIRAINTRLTAAQSDRPAGAGQSHTHTAGLEA